MTSCIRMDRETENGQELIEGQFNSTEITIATYQL